MIVVVLGPQGSGKGTQAELLSQNLGYFHMESGRMFRQKAETDKRIKEMLNTGTLVPDQETVDLIEDCLTKNNVDMNNLIFDGYPRTASQYRLLKNWLLKKGKKVDLVFYIDISEKETIRRLSARRTCEKCGAVYNLITNPPPTDKCECSGNLLQREDDRPETIKKRLEVFGKQTQSMIDLIEKEGVLIKIDGERPINLIHKEIVGYLRESN